MSQTATIQLPAPVTSRADRLSKPTLFTRRLNVSTPLTAGATTPSEKDPNEAWKYEGYQEFSRWMASDDDLFIFRRFESVNAHVILWMQHQITQKEARLEEIHTMIKKAQPEQRLRNDSFSWDAQWFGERDNLMRELSALVLHYNKYVDAFASMRSRPTADQRQIRNVKTWLSDKSGEFRNAIKEDEAKPYLDARYAKDLSSISSRTRPPLGKWLEGCTRLQTSRLFRDNRTEGTPATTIYSSNEKFEKLTNRSIIAGGLVMLLAPLWLLEFFTGSRKRLGIITAFVVSFMLLMTTATINRPFEVVAATAAYAAVLMVFMQIEPLSH